LSLAEAIGQESRACGVLGTVVPIVQHLQKHR